MIRLFEEEESQAHDGGTSHVVIYVGDGNVQQLLDCLIVAGAAVRHCNCVHARSKQLNGV